jgi:hypothetical protein
MPLQTTEVDSPITFTYLQPATTVNVRVNSPIATTVYDAQVTNLHDGTDIISYIDLPNLNGISLISGIIS